jgi:predicted phage-related endonuclease
MLARHRYGEALTRARLRAVLVYEQRTGRPQDDRYVSVAMARAVALEPFAVAAYEARTGLVVRTTGFLRHDRLPVGCSLDGHVGDFEGIVEIKCPQSPTHLDYWRTGRLPPAYRAQVTHNLWVSGAQ